MLKILDQTAEEMTVLLPSCISATVGKMKTHHAKTFTNLGNLQEGKGLIRMLGMGLVKSVGEDKDIDEAFIQEMTNEDISVLAIAVRVNSYRKRTDLKLQMEWQKDKQKQKATHVISVSANDFDIQYNTEDETAPDEPKWTRYADIPKTYSVGKISFDLLTLTRLQKILKGKKMTDLDAFARLQGARLRKGENNFLSEKEYGDLDIELNDELHELFLKVHGNVDSKVTLRCPWDESQAVPVDLLQQEAFFCPSLAQR